MIGLPSDLRGVEVYLYLCQASTPDFTRDAGSTEDCDVSSVVGVSSDRRRNLVDRRQPDLSRCAARMPCL